MKTKKAVEWITQGYKVMAMKGSSGLNVEAIARAIQKNKSSFYYYFGTMEVFEATLLEYHIERVHELAAAIKKCQSIRPDLFHVFINYQTDLFFHKQLRVHREKESYRLCFEQAFAQIEAAMLPQWAAFLGLENQQFFANAFLQLVAENFLLQITPPTFDYAWLDDYLRYIHSFWRQMQHKE